MVWYVVYLLEALFFNPTAKGLMRLKQTVTRLNAALESLGGSSAWRVVVEG